MSKASMQDIERLKSEVIQCALLLAERQSWADITFYKISEKSGFKVSDIHSIFEDKDAILWGYVRQVDLKLSHICEGKHSLGEADKDRLFDVMMERFDILNENRASVISILNSITLDPKQSLSTFPHLFKSMTKMLELATIPAHGIGGTLKIIALTVIYIKVLRVWIKDDSSDMSPTMASLDKALSYLDKI